jgi:putative SOS response-associated peptidase YedK
MRDNLDRPTQTCFLLTRTMCGRYTLRVSPAELAEIFATLREIEWSPRYNIAPTQTVIAVRQTDDGRELALLRWGLIPSWAKDAKIGNSLINARADGVATKPSFRHAFKKKRCLIPVDGFYEWQAVPGQKAKQPFHIGLCDSPVFAFAGLWESWTDPVGKTVETSTIITTDANEAMQKVHNRMPVILDPADYDEWLDRGQQDVERLQKLLRPYPAEQMRLTPVSTLVNSPRNEKPECVVPI